MDYKKIALWAFVIVIFYGITEAFNFNHFEQGRTWPVIIPFVFWLFLTAIVVFSIIPAITEKRTDFFLVIAIIFYAQLLEDLTHTITYFFITGKFTFWYPIFPYVYILDIILGSTFLYTWKKVTTKSSTMY